LVEPVGDEWGTGTVVGNAFPLQIVALCVRRSSNAT